MIAATPSPLLMERPPLRHGRQRYVHRGFELRRSLWSGLHCGSFGTFTAVCTGSLRRSLWSGLHCGSPFHLNLNGQHASPLLMERPPLRHRRQVVNRRGLRLRRSLWSGLHCGFWDLVRIRWSGKRSFAAPYGAASIAARGGNRDGIHVPDCFAAPYGAASIAAETCRVSQNDEMFATSPLLMERPPLRQLTVEVVLTLLVPSPLLMERPPLRHG